ncbi:MAG: spermidine/putrescine ABC transporter substrate-binding protein [Phycisphaeraceae bacterium]
MLKNSRVFVLLALAMFLVGCGGQSQKEINVLIWLEYIDDAIVADFTKQTGLKVNLSYFEKTEEMIAKLQHAGGASQYDVVIAPNQSIPMLVRLKLIQPLDHSQLPNLKNLDEAFADPSYDPGCKHSAAYQWGTVGIIYNKKKHPKLEPSWATVFDAAKQPGPFLLIDDMRDQLGVALKYLGHSVNTNDRDQLKLAGELVLAAKKGGKSLGFKGGSGALEQVVIGGADMAIVYNGDAIKAVAQDTEGTLAYFTPAEGSVLWADTMVIPSQAKNANGAHLFINYILDAKIGARLSNHTRFATPNKAAMPFISEDDRLNSALYPTEAMMKKLEYLQDMGEAMKMYDEIWTSVKTR